MLKNCDFQASEEHFLQKKAAFKINCFCPWKFDSGQLPKNIFNEHIL
jgi:hypothetical protein